MTGLWHIDSNCDRTPGVHEGARLSSESEYSMGLIVIKPGPEVIKLFSCSTQVFSTEHEISTAHKN